MKPERAKTAAERRAARNARRAEQRGEEGQSILAAAKSRDFGTAIRLSKDLIEQKKEI